MQNPNATPDPDKIAALEQAIADREAEIRAKLTEAGVTPPTQKGLKRTPSPHVLDLRRATRKRQRASRRRNRS